MLDEAFYELLQETGGAIFQAVADMRARLGVEDEPPPPLLQLRGGLAESPGWYLVQAVEFAPEPLTVERLRVRDIYASERIAQALLEMMASERWLERIGDTYTLTEMGWAMSRRSRERTRSLLAGLEPLPPADLDIPADADRADYHRKPRESHAAGKLVSCPLAQPRAGCQRASTRPSESVRQRLQRLPR